MGMNPRLLRPTQNLRPDAASWAARVSANGASVTASTLKAVNQFCKDIDAAKIRDRFYRLNLFCGTGLNACLVPLYRGPSLGGTQYGDAIDTNNGPFLPANYSETDAGGGLTGNGSTRYLSFGTISSLKPSWIASHHFGLDISGAYPDGSNRYQMGAFFNETPTSPRGNYAINGLNTGGRGDSGIPTRSGFTNSANLKMVVRASGSDMRLFEDGTQVATTQATADTASVLPGGQFCVMASSYQNVSGGTPTTIVNGYAASVGICRGYTIGEAMDSTQRVAFASAWIAFQQAMGRR